jgi:regulatory protein
MSTAPDLQRWITEMERFCAFQERSPNEIRLKLGRKGLHEGQIEAVIEHLTSHNFLNEQRFVEAYVQGKFKIKGWGKHKIKAGLKTHRIPEHLIQVGLSQLETNDQDKRLADWFEKKKQALRNEPEGPQKTAKIVRFLLSKGYEMSAILELVRLS